MRLALAMLLLLAGGTASALDRKHDIGELDEFWRTIRAAPTVDAAIIRVTERFGVTPIEFRGQLSNGNDTWVRVLHVGFRDLDYYAHVPVVEVDVSVAEPHFDLDRRRTVSVWVNSRAAGSDSANQ